MAATGVEYSVLNWPLQIDLGQLSFAQRIFRSVYVQSFHLIPLPPIYVSIFERQFDTKVLLAALGP